MRVFVLTSLLTFMISCQPKDLPTVIDIKENAFTVKFSHMTTKSEIEDVAKKVAFTGGELDYSQSSFFDDGKLKTLKLTLKSPLGHVGTTRSELMGLQYGYVGFSFGPDGSMSIGKM
jgi:hypothetical protein